MLYTCWCSQGVPGQNCINIGGRSANRMGVPIRSPVLPQQILDLVRCRTVSALDLVLGSNRSRSPRSARCNGLPGRLLQAVRRSAISCSLPAVWHFLSRGGALEFRAPLLQTHTCGVMVHAWELQCLSLALLALWVIETERSASWQARRAL